MSDFVYKVYKPYRFEDNNRLVLGAIEIIKRTAKQVTVKNCQASGYRRTIKESDSDRVYDTEREAWEAALAERNATIKQLTEKMDETDAERLFIVSKILEVSNG